ncbi:TraR/DksA family transcriptional regulator [Bacillus kexueae]|uniref:TraR/DksA family transcriptional regulator n=1 Tax=Aeribacillus kexueae TaxID=2078952 RepID=UPI001FAF6927
MAHLNDIEKELQLMKEELQSCLMDHHQLQEEIRLIMKEELLDVERALWKLSTGQYGICEQTSQLIPIPLLHLYPTARTVDDLSLQRYFVKGEVLS